MGRAVNGALRLGSSIGWALRPAGITVWASWSDWAGGFSQQLARSADLLLYSGTPLNVLCSCLASMTRLPGGAGQEPCSAVGQADGLLSCLGRAVEWAPRFIWLLAGDPNKAELLTEFSGQMGP